jgi:uncharacterized protein YdeI (BOF family)
MKKSTLVAFAFLLSVASSRAASSEPPQITPVSWIVDTRHNINVDDKRVTIVGEVIKHDDGSDWWFADTTGSVRLDTDDKELPIGKRLVVTGRIDQSRFGVGHLEIEVSHWEYADKVK